MEQLSSKLQVCATKTVEIIGILVSQPKIMHGMSDLST